MPQDKFDTSHSTDAVSSPLQDIAAIAESRPDLTADQWEVVDKASEWLKATMRPTVRLELEEEYLKKYDEFRTELREASQVQIKKLMEEWKASQEPLSQKDLQKLLNQEYQTFDVPLVVRSGVKRNTVKRQFTLVELPQEFENRFVSILKDRIIPILEKLNSAQFSFDANWTVSLQKAIDTFPDVLQTVSELVAICLNPWGDEEDITAEWVRRNISSIRQVRIVRGQVEVNKYRDFFSKDFQLFRI